MARPLPPAIPPRLPMPGVRNAVVMASAPVTVAAPTMRSLPVPMLVPTELPRTPAARAAVIEHVKAEAEKPKRGRKTKLEEKKMEKAAMSERVAALLEKNPSKKDVLEYMRTRVSELAD